MNVCRAINCNRALFKRNHVYCREHYHLNQLSSLRVPGNNRKRLVKDSLGKRCQFAGCKENVFREYHTHCRYHYHLMKL